MFALCFCAFFTKKCEPQERNDNDCNAMGFQSPQSGRASAASAGVSGVQGDFGGFGKAGVQDGYQPGSDPL